MKSTHFQKIPSSVFDQGFFKLGMSDLFVRALTVFMLTPLEDPTLFVGRLQTPPAHADATHLTGDDEAIPRAPATSVPRLPFHCHSPMSEFLPLIKLAICC